ncbi:V-type proton ATPase subunit G [Penicillium subrubescens]|uniref:V-type proton ATPase subunit G n=1 Tax=Penicillium subrubescens TaxID=1316194 RepID=A0A1Q5UQ68_9EURO|nr:V-type proton ATPase subunit G [Penicillium subrubescens]
MDVEASLDLPIGQNGRRSNRAYLKAEMVGNRTKRIRDAKAEAQKEIEEYRNQKEEEYKKFEAEHSSGFKVAEEEANKEAEEKLKEIQAAGKKHGDKVVEDLIKATTDVKPQVPEKIVQA